MTCDRSQDLLLSSLDGGLSIAEQTELDGHLASCPACVRLMKEFVVTSQLMRGWDEADSEDAAPALPEALVRRILEARTAEETAPQRKRTTG
jgi:anti-sigma factor RsiW